MLKTVSFFAIKLRGVNSGRPIRFEPKNSDSGGFRLDFFQARKKI